MTRTHAFTHVHMHTYTPLAISSPISQLQVWPGRYQWSAAAAVGVLKLEGCSSTVMHCLYCCAVLQLPPHR